MPLAGLSRGELALLAKYDTPTVCNVIELFNVRPRNAGYTDRRVTACFPELPPMVGYAATATFRSAAPAKGDAYAGLVAQVEALGDVPAPQVVVFQDLDDPPVGATFGEVMCSAYKAFGASGLVTSGAGRDLDQIRSLDFPAFTDGAICAHGYCHIESVGVPVRVGGVTIHPGDLLHGDRNGVTTIPGDIASEVAAACERFVAAEAGLLEYLHAGAVTPEGFAEADAGCRSMIAKLREDLAERQR